MKISKNKSFPGHYTAVRMTNFDFLAFALANRKGVPGRFAKWDRLLATFCAASHRFDDSSGNIIIFLYKFVLGAWLEEQ